MAAFLFKKLVAMLVRACVVGGVDFTVPSCVISVLADAWFMVFVSAPSWDCVGKF